MWRWDIFCAVVDHYGDIGVCWRLAQGLVNEHGANVRLWVDNLERFACVCPSISLVADVQHIGPIEIRLWKSDFPDVDPADVVIEAFACTIPADYVNAMARRAVPPVWINLEYLSAESWVEECHGLPSSHSTLPLRKYFYFPGFTSKTGGLLRERDLLTDRAEFDMTAAAEFWSSLGIAPRSEDEIRISLFCYDNDALSELLQTWADGLVPIQVFVSPGPAVHRISTWLGETLSPKGAVRNENPLTPSPSASRRAGVSPQGPRRAGMKTHGEGVVNSLTVHALPFLTQSRYDRLLWACDVNFVRGEDSFVRAQWAQRPFVWHIYPQADNAHRAKLDAFLARYLDGFDHPSYAEAVRRFWIAWNMGRGITDAWRDYVENRHSILEHGRVWATVLDRLGNLVDNLVRFAREKSFREKSFD